MLEVYLYSFFNLSAGWGWVVIATAHTLYSHNIDSIPIVQGARCAPRPVRKNAENLVLTGIRSPDRPASSEVVVVTTLSYLSLYEIEIITDREGPD